MQATNCKKLFDSCTDAALSLLKEEERIRMQRLPSIRTVLVVLSCAGMVYDPESLRQQILIAYADAVLFFITSSGKPLGTAPPQYVDLVIDFTGPGQREKLFLARKLRRMARVVVGRRWGSFRAKAYDRVYDEKAKAGQLPLDFLERERLIHRAVLESVGIALAKTGSMTLDRGHCIARELVSSASLEV